MRFNLDFTPNYGQAVQVSPLIRRVVAQNPGPYTFYGTGTYIVGRGEVAVIDPGPALPAHLAALMRALEGERVSHILVTHTHLDHSPLARDLQQASGAPTYGFGPHGQQGERVEAGADHHFLPDVVLRDGDRLAGGGWSLEAVHTPGHTSNHLCFALAEEQALFPGDHVMGWSTTVVAPPDGSMADYMASLRRLAARGDRTYWPTHGNPIREPASHLADLIAHRLERRAKVLAALDQQPRQPLALVPAVYGPALDPRLTGGAAQSLRAHLIELVAEGLAREDAGGWRKA